MMKQTQEIKSFFYSQYFADGLRITIGCIVPVLIFATIGQFTNGTIVSLGALLVGLSDTPGAPSHRRKGMFAGAILTTLTFILTNIVNQNVYLLAIFIGIACFIFAMFAVFNSRAANVGLMCILMMLIHVQTHYPLDQAISYLGFYTLGGLWYIAISLSITQVRPYRLAEQELAETIRYVADYIRLKANFYDAKIDNDKNYLKLIDKQVEVNQHQENVRDLLFQSKRSIKDTTKVGRYLTLIFNDIVDLFEQSMAAHYDYNTISERFGPTGILEDFKNVILKYTNELDNLAYQLNTNIQPKPLYDFDADLTRLHAKIDQLDKENQYSTFALRKVLINLRDLVRRIKNIYGYSHLQPDDVKKKEIDDAKRFVQSSAIDLKKFRENLTLKSTIFRHACRMAIVMSVTYYVFETTNITNNVYWILLTIMVILKPGFGLTKERNIQRLIGTTIGGLIGAGILLTIHDPTILFVLLVFFFLTAYSLFRVNYVVAVLFMTPYVLIMFSFISSNTLEVTKERILDTFIGGMIAFLSSYIIFPNWESMQVKESMRKLLIANYNYIFQALKEIAGQAPSITDYKLARKAVYVETANMGSTFQRMLTEPKKRQKYSKEVNKFVIFNHILASFSVTLMNHLDEMDNNYLNKDHVRTIRKILNSLDQSIQLLYSSDSSSVFSPMEIEISNHRFDNSDINSADGKLLEEQLEFLYKIAQDLNKIVRDLHDKSAAEQATELSKLAS
ncbi:FUSC family protein [Sphingobacterium sp. DR205]|uniref:FUSC family protein n=2 Tax=Sphingobacteriaceae TaxID=84566 RepID=A0A363NX11_9SPHI|nr:FUSC family protein [Sphingobacterium athyrii]QIH37165.1 FUSC family protein [Sphingobacterium sp. DR205]